MALSDKYTLFQLRNLVRRDILDPTARWWTDTELNTYLTDWQQTIQTQYEFVWGSATTTTTNTNTATATTTTFLLTNVATNIMRVDAIYISTQTGATITDTSTTRLSPRSLIDLDTLQRDWRSILPAQGVPPNIVYQNDAFSVSIFPPPYGTTTLYFEYPALLTFVADTSTMQIPAWARYSCIPYCSYRAYARFGVNQDLNKAQRRRRMWERQLNIIKRIYDGYFPEHTDVLRPGRKWAGQILRAKPAWPVWS